MSEVNRSINIYLNESEVEASLGRLNKSAVKLEEQMKDIADKSSPKFTELSEELNKVNGKMNTLSKQMSGEIGASIRQMEGNISKLRNELKNSATGTDEFNKKLKELAGAEANLKKVQKEMNGVRDAVANAGKSSGVFSTLKNSITSFASSLPGVGAAFTALTGPIGIVIGIIGGLVAILKENAEVADAISFAMGAFRKIVQTLADDLVGLIKNGFGKLKEAIANPKQALIDFGKAIIDNVINHFKALGVIIDAVVTGDFKKLGNGVIQLVTGIENGADKIQKFGEHLGEAGKSGWDAAEALDHLAQKQAELQAAIERTNIQIAEQTTLYKDTTRSDEDRIAAAKKVVELETLNSNRKIKQINLEIAAYKEQYKNITLNGEQEAHLTNLSLSLSRERAAGIDAIRKASLAAASLDHEMAIAKNVKTEELAAQGIKSITAQTTDGITEMAKVAETEMEKVPMKFSQKFEDFQSQLNTFMSEWGGTVQAGIQTIQNVFGVVSDSMAIQGDKEIAAEKRHNNTRVKELDKLLKHKKISQADYNKEIAKMDAALEEKQREQKKKAFKADKASKIVSAVINTALAVVNALATMPYPASIVMAALAGATGAAQIGVIAAQPMPQFAKGGYLNGPSHQAGGMAVVGYGGQKVAEVEGGEFIVNRQSTRKHFNLLNALNAEGNGGKYARFNAGGVLSAVKYAAGGLFTPQGDSGSMQQQILLLQNIYDSLQQPVPAVVDYGEVKRRGDDLNRAKGRASFSQ